MGVQVAYSVVTAASAGSTSSIEALLSSTATVTAMSTDLAKTIPGVTVQSPLMLDPSSAPTRAPTFAPSSLQPTKQTVVLSPTVEMVVTPSPSAFAGVLNTVYVSQSVTSATLTVAQAQSSSFLTAFAVGIQNAVPGVTVTVTSVSAARRRLLASVAVSYSASSATASTSALTASLSSPSTIAAASASLVAAGYAGVSVSSPVFASAVGSGSSSTSGGSNTNGGSGTNAGVIAGATVGVLVPFLVGLALLIVYLVKPELLGCNKSHGTTRATNAHHMAPAVGSMVSHPTRTAVGASHSASAGNRSATSASPPRFTAYLDDRTGHTYYVDGTSGATVWNRPGDLLPGWSAELDSASGRLFYLHKESCTTSWERPDNDHAITTPVHVGQVEIDVSSNENDDDTLQQHTWANSRPPAPPSPPSPHLPPSRSTSLVHLESIYTTQDEEPPFYADNGMYNSQAMYVDQTSSQKSSVSASSTAVVGRSVQGGVVPFVLPRPRRPSFEGVVRWGSEVEQEQEQGQGQWQGYHSQSCVDHTLSDHSQPNTSTSTSTTLPTFGRPRDSPVGFDRHDPMHPTNGPSTGRPMLSIVETEQEERTVSQTPSSESTTSTQSNTPMLPYAPTDTPVTPWSIIRRTPPPTPNRPHEEDASSSAAAAAAASIGIPPPLPPLAPLSPLPPLAPLPPRNDLTSNHHDDNHSVYSPPSPGLSSAANTWREVDPSPAPVGMIQHTGEDAREVSHSSFDGSIMIDCSSIHRLNAPF